ncbi:T9SS type A sorting domain-containing protein [Hymenobacter sp. ASUV-10]|uniref:T9SS type A sorting domain-containing protein n=1 Tax=Hymenobacter aranciens TaxID=3063996 RepID=A0ABT9BAV5_9BACT|nr:T9SS type A sorting domain-containing protein [Hymenobacter sp. ASUV-10]MDO7874824.1 T9SS type A sorting domain-containing protein [Hymenobacter sp. ASUV-10]
MLLPTLGQAQVNLYTFNQGPGTYTPITGGTVAGTATAGSNFSLDDSNFTLAAGTIPFTFTFNGTGYTGLVINTNGYITFGTTAPDVSGYSPISATTGYAGAVAAIGHDLVGDATAATLGQIRYETVGTAPNRSFVIQYSNFKRYTSSIQADNLNFQIRLNETNNTINFVYNTPTVAATSTGLPQVGLRGASNAAYNNRTTTTNWSASTAGTTNAATMTLSNTVKPASGLTYTFTPPAPCTAPPTAGTAVASVPNGCTSIASTTISLTGSATGTGVTYQWQQSATGVAGSFTNASGTSTNATYTATSVTSTTYYQAIVTCSGQSATSTPVQVTVNSAIPAYAALPVTQGFESWISRCGNLEVPGANWRATPITGDNAWRRNDQGFTTAGWRYPADEPAPYLVSSSQGSYSARFHSFGTASGGIGSLDLFVDLSAAGTKTLTFDYINPTGTDKLDILLSSDGGANFSATPLLTLTTASAFGGQSITFTGTSATSVVRFRATSDFGNDDLGIDNLLLRVTPACPGVAFSPTTSITSTGATINFAAVTGATDYTVSYSPGGGSQTVTNAGAVPLTGLQPYTVYTVTVTTNCGGGQSGTATTSFRTGIGNDECSGAVALTPGAPGASCSAATYTTSGATASTVTSPCTTITDGDVWFSFVASGSRHTITVVPTFDFDAVIELRSGSCPGTNVSCQNASASGGGAGTEALIASGLTSGQTYLVRVYSAIAGAGSGNFDICITTPPNLPCAQVTNAAVTTASGTATASTGELTFTPAAGATDYLLTLAPTAGGTTSTATVTSSPVSLSGLTPNTSYTITISTNCTNGGVSNPVSVVFTSAAAPIAPANDNPTGAIALTVASTCTPTSGTNVGATTTTPAGYTNPGTCGVAINPIDVWYSFTTAAAGAGSTGAVLTVTGNPAGLVRVFSSTGGAAGPFTQVACSAGSTNNTVAPALTVTGLTASTTYYVSVSGYGSGDTTGSFTICATLPPSCSPPTGVAVSSITTTTASVTFTGNGTGNTSYTATATPATGSPVTATGTATPIALTGLTPGVTYSLVLAGNCGAAGAAAPVSFTTTGLPPTNDLCTGATTITCGQTLNGTTVNATSTGEPTTACGSDSNSPSASPSVFYSFVGTGDIVTVSTCGAGTTIDTELFVYSGSCGALTCVNSNDDFSGCSANSAASQVTFTSVLGTTYYFMVQRYSSTSAVGAFALSVSCTPVPNLVVNAGNSPYSASGTFNNVTIANGGTANLSADLTVLGTLTINDGGTLNTAGSQVVGTGNFVLQAGGTLGIRGTAGITAGPATTGVIRNTGATRSFSPDASYVYNGTAAQVTGNGLPATVRNITVNNSAGVTLSQALSVRQLARMQSGNLATNGNTFTLLSVAGQGTALIDNTGGLVTGTGTMQRAIDATNPAGIGYRHYAAPVTNTTVADLAAGAFAPVVNPAYNSAVQPGFVTPFPTVFGYDETRIATVTNNFSDFNKGWVSPTATSDAMVSGKGYTANIPDATLVDFTGTFKSGASSNTGLTRGPSPEAGWHLLGNPYPSPLDWDLVDNSPATSLPGMDNAMYVFQSTGQYTGNYRSYVNGVGTSPIIDAGSGFFVRVAAAGTPGSVNLTNAHRVTTFGPQPAFGRSNDVRPLLTLNLSGNGQQDETSVYFEAGATAGHDSQFDAVKRLNMGTMSLGTALNGQEFAINGLAPLTSLDVVLPLTLSDALPGSYTFEAPALRNFGSTTVYLRDAATGTQTILSQGTRYQFTLAANAGPGRFSLLFRPTGVTGTRNGFEAAQVLLYPNPAHGAFTLSVPAVANARSVQATLLNALGQQVSTRSLPLGSTGAVAEFSTANLAAGVYVLQLRAGEQLVTKRVVVE